MVHSSLDGCRAVRAAHSASYDRGGKGFGKIALRDVTIL